MEDTAKVLQSMAPQVGLEPTTLRLTAECSAIELLRSVVGWSGEKSRSWQLLYDSKPLPRASKHSPGSADLAQHGLGCSPP